MAIENAKMLNVRIRSKYDNYENWVKSNLVLEPGEIAIAYTTVDVKVDNGTAKHPALLMKVGNGSDTFANLPWLSARAADVLTACKSEEALTTFINEVIADAGIASDDAMEALAGRVTVVEKDLNTAETGLKARVTTAEGAITVLETLVGDDTVANQIKDAIDALNLSDTYEKVGVAKSLVDPVVKDVAENTAAITTLNADAETAGSVDYKIAENDTFETDILTVNATGGIKANEDLDGLTTHEILRKLLYPYVAQEVGTPSRTPNGSIFEKGNTQTITSVSVKVTKKSEAITSVALYNGSILIAEKTGDEVAAGGTFTFSGLSVEVPSTSVVLTVKATDASGNVVSKNTAGWTFVYPYYIGTCAENATIDEALVEGLTKKIEDKGNKSHTFNCDYQRMVFAYPKAHGALKSILDPNSFEILGSFTQHEVSVTGLNGTAQAYYVYVNAPSTVSNFVVTFKY